MSTEAKVIEFRAALSGGKGELDSWLEVHDEDELRSILGAAINSDTRSLRDYFAAKALQGLLSAPDTAGDEVAFAHDAYRQADAMLKAREQQS